MVAAPSDARFRKPFRRKSAGGAAARGWELRRDRFHLGAARVAAASGLQKKTVCQRQGNYATLAARGTSQAGWGTVAPVSRSSAIAEGFRPGDSAAPERMACRSGS